MKYYLKTFDCISEELSEIWKKIQIEGYYHPFQSDDWIKKWIQTVGSKKNIKPIFIAIFTGNECSILIPLSLKIYRGFRIIEMISAENCDYCSPILGKNYDEGFQIKLLWKEIKNNLPQFDYLNIRNQPEFINGKKNPLFVLGKGTINNSYFLKLTNTDYNTFIKKNIKKKILADTNRQIKRLKEFGNLEFKVEKDFKSNYKFFFDIFITQKTVQYNITNSYNIFKNKEVYSFYKSIFDYKNNINHCSYLLLNDEIIAVHLGLLSNKSFYYIFPSYDRKRYAKFSPGRILLLFLIEWSINHGYEIFDFTVGAENYKKDWVNSENRLNELLIANNLKGEIYFFLQKLFLTIKNIYKKSKFLKSILSSKNPIFKIFF